MVKVFEKVEIAKESELEDIVRKHPDQLEDGLVYLEHQVHVGRGFLDVLLVDSKAVLVAAELKVNDDEGILTQALKYYDSVERDKDRLARHFASKAKIDETLAPRILLVAPSFSEEMVKAARHVSPDITLLEFEYLKTRTGEKGLRCKPVMIEPESYFRPPVRLEKIIAYVYSQKLRDTCNQVVRDILDIGGDLDEPKGIGKTEIRFRYKNRWLANIHTRHNLFYVEYLRGKFVEIHEPRDWRRHRELALGAVARTYRELGGTPK